MKVTILLFALFATASGYSSNKGFEDAYNIFESFSHANSKGDGAVKSVLAAAVLRKAMVYLDQGIVLDSPTQNKTGCSCVKYNCGCCLDLKVKEIHLDDTVCVNFTYLPAPEYGISLTLSFDGKVFINETISARNPPPICVDVPYLKQYLSLCLKFTDMQVTNNTLSGCLLLQFRFLKIKIEDIELGCFKIPPGGVISSTSFKIAEVNLRREQQHGQGQKVKVKALKQGQNVKDSYPYWKSLNRN